jgi:hypothetical protein
MKLNLPSLCLVVLGALSTTALAQDNAAFLKQVDAKSAQMKRCADIARALEKIPVPANHAEAKNIAASSAIAKEKVAPVIDPAHANFEAAVRRMDQDFGKCGNELFKDLAQVEGKMKPFMEGVKKQKMADAEQKSVSQSLGGYMKAKEDLQSAVELLSKDKQMEAYVGKTLIEQYLNQKY